MESDQVSENEFSDNDCMNLIYNIHKKMMHVIAENLTEKISIDTCFTAGTLALSITLSAFLNTYQIKDIDKYMKDFVRTFKDIHTKINDNSYFLHYKDGKFIKEEKYN
jgi:hypothetical protein